MAHPSKLQCKQYKILLQGDTKNTQFSMKNELKFMQAFKIPTSNDNVQFVY